MKDDRSQTGLQTLSDIRRNPSDPEAWRRFVARYGPKIVSWCSRWNLQEADVQDVAQNVLLKLHSALPKFVYNPGEGKTFHGWLKRVVQTTLATFTRRRRQEGRLDFEPMAEDGAQLELIAALDAEHEREVLTAAMEEVRGQFSETTFEAFRLSAVEGLSGKIVADRLSIPVDNVFAYKSKVLKRLQAIAEKLRLAETAG